jgi:hypothetical protein
MLSEQHFEMVAQVITDPSLHLQSSKTRALASRFADVFAQANPRFDRERFLTYVEDLKDQAER